MKSSKEKADSLGQELNSGGREGSKGKGNETENDDEAHLCGCIYSKLCGRHRRVRDSLKRCRMGRGREGERERGRERRLMGNEAGMKWRVEAKKHIAGQPNSSR